MGCIFLLLYNLSAQNKYCLSFGLRYNQTNINNNIYNILIFSSNFDPLSKGSQYLVNNIGSEIKFTRSIDLSKSLILNTGLIFQEDRSDFVSNYVVYGKRHFRNLGLNILFEKRIEINSEFKLGFSLGTLINRSITGGGKNENIQNNSTTVGVIDRGSSNLNLNSNGDTISNMTEYEKLYFKTSKIKFTPRIELNAYLKSGKNQFKFSAFFQFEAKKYNYHEYSWGFNDIKNGKKFDAEPYNTDLFRMKIFGISTGYCF